MVGPAQQAALALDATVVDMRFVKPLDTALVTELAARHSLLVTIEEHQIMGGAGSAVAEALAEAGLAVRAFQQGELNFEKALQEAQRLDALGLLADAVGQAQALESAVLKLHTSWRRLGGLQERLWVESGSSTPHLRDLLVALQTLSGSTMRVSLGELAGGKRVRLQLVEESPDRLEAPPLP